MMSSSPILLLVLLIGTSVAIRSNPLFKPTGKNGDYLHLYKSTLMTKIPDCKDLPHESPIEAAERSLCTNKVDIYAENIDLSAWNENNRTEDQQIFCTNLLILNLRREICLEFAKNTPKFHQAMIEVIYELGGLGNFGSTPMGTIYDKIESKTNLKLRDIKPEIINLMFEVILEVGKKEDTEDKKEKLTYTYITDNNNDGV